MSEPEDESGIEFSGTHEDEEDVPVEPTPPSET